MASGLSKYRASRKSALNDPGPQLLATARSPHIPATAQAAATAFSWFGACAVKAATSADNAQPVPTTRVMSGCPPVSYTHLDVYKRQGVLHAPGSITLSDLELTSASGTIMGLPRNAAIALMKNRKGKISVNFVLEGNINDPHFSLNENLTTRIATSLGGTLGVSVEELTKGVGTVGSSAAKGLSDTIGKLFKK